MPVTGIALDIGTSGIRALAIDREAGDAIASAATSWHPLPGTNLIDHLLFSATFGQDLARRIMIRTINGLVEILCDPHSIESMAICGNTGQISLVMGAEIRDLLMSPASLGQKGIRIPDRSARSIDARTLGLEVSCDLHVPPAIRAEVGADALALIHKSGMIGKNSVMAVDLGTNAEMALSAGGKIYVGSAAAGPAIEGQHIRHGMLAAPGAIAGIAYDWGWTLQVLDDTLHPAEGDTIDLGPGTVRRKGQVQARGITGTGVISLVSAGLGKGIITPSNIRAPGGNLVLQDGISFSEEDLVEAGKAFGAIRAGQMTLAETAGTSIDTIHTCHLAGTAGSFVDPLRARDVEIVPPSAGTIVRHGNTSLEMAADLAAGTERLETLQRIADEAEHVAFSGSRIFSDLFIHELAYWCEGAPRFRKTKPWPDPAVHQKPPQWIPETTTFTFPQYRVPVPDWTENSARILKVCPHHALKAGDAGIEVDLRLCRGTSCLRCQRSGLAFDQPDE
ncbi:ASKHA domain-containing protein [Methanosphaerula subterraneus]|uniref:ASKHA domain-containing protein n=1 Tax=Methanosphaerula subterraneus TaxID=3350244 RepID=UPI003F82D928